jgi:hypothetical protein
MWLDNDDMRRTPFLVVWIVLKVAQKTEVGGGSRSLVKNRSCLEWGVLRLGNVGVSRSSSFCDRV